MKDDTKKIIELTTRLIKFKTETKENVIKAQDFISKWLSSSGVRTEKINNNNYISLVSSLGPPEKKKIILNGHVDVVKAIESQYVPYIDGDRLYGRGSLDMLGSIAVMMLLAKDLKKVEHQLSTQVEFQFTPDEETGGFYGSRTLVERGYLGDFVICLEPTNLNIALQAKGVIQLEIDVFGKSAHGSRPWLGENAIIKALSLYNEIESASFTKSRSQYFSRYSVNLSSIKSLNPINVVPDRCKMKIEIRYLPEQDPNNILREIKTIISGHTLKVLNIYDPVIVSKDDEYVQSLERVYKTTIDDTPIYFGQDGTADTRYFTSKNIPAIELGPLGNDQHGSNEYVSVQSLVNLKKILLNFLTSFG